MCLINFHFKNHQKYKLIVVANRDEEYNRPTKEAHFWEDESTILAGRDLLQMGTWLGVSKNGKFAALTNFRDPSLPIAPKTRGEIVKDFLTSDKNPEEFITLLRGNRHLYGGYNIVIGNGDSLYHYNNIFDESNKITPGTHSLSNCTLNTPWPKVVKARNKLEQIASQKDSTLRIDQLFEMVSDKTLAPIEELPNTGVGLELEKLLSPIFIQMSHYGTRCSTVVLIDRNNKITFVERTYHNGEFQFDQTFEF
ncbi:MAG TPA: NRDE family protein [Ureibacillus sp.]|nr:NRDE family protein [Ureibacillus sp.]